MHATAHLLTRTDFPRLRRRAIETLPGSLRGFYKNHRLEMPTLSLDAIRLQRPDVAEGTTQAQITFTFFVDSSHAASMIALTCIS